MKNKIAESMWCRRDFAAGVGVALVPRSVQGLHRADVVYRPLANKGVFLPVIMNSRASDRSVLLEKRRITASRIVQQSMSHDPE